MEILSHCVDADCSKKVIDEILEKVVSMKEVGVKALYKACMYALCGRLGADKGELWRTFCLVDKDDKLLFDINQDEGVLLQTAIKEGNRDAVEFLLKHNDVTTGVTVPMLIDATQLTFNARQEMWNNKMLEVYNYMVQVCGFKAEELPAFSEIECMPCIRCFTPNATNRLFFEASYLVSYMNDDPWTWENVTVTCRKCNASQGGENTLDFLRSKECTVGVWLEILTIQNTGTPNFNDGVKPCDVEFPRDLPDEFFKFFKNLKAQKDAGTIPQKRHGVEQDEIASIKHEGKKPKIETDLTAVTTSDTSSSSTLPSRAVKTPPKFQWNS